MQPEVWLRGPITGINAVLQPVAHALLQSQEEVNALMESFPDSLLWETPAGVASPGFHLQHLAGVADRLTTYANGQTLTQSQLAALASEQLPPSLHTTTAELVARFNKQVAQVLEQLHLTTEESLLEKRSVGRAQLPSTVIGLLFHVGEHTQRHVGQLYVTVKVLMASIT